jgi:hypothetical protein
MGLEKINLAIENDALPSSLMDSTASPKVKIMKREGVGEREGVEVHSLLIALWG